GRTRTSRCVPPAPRIPIETEAPARTTVTRGGGPPDDEPAAPLEPVWISYSSVLPTCSPAALRSTIAGSRGASDRDAVRGPTAAAEDELDPPRTPKNASSARSQRTRNATPGFSRVWGSLHHRASP